MRYRIHHFKINAREGNEWNKLRFFFYMRHFWTLYRVFSDGSERVLHEWHLEMLIHRRDLKNNWLSIRFHTGNESSETPWDGHFILFGAGFNWGHNFFRKWASRISRCSGYKYDTRDWSLRIFDNRFWWQIAEHSDMCDKLRPMHVDKRMKNRRKRRRRSWRAGSINLSIPEAIWGPQRYFYETVDSVATVLKFEDGEYPVLIDLQKTYFGRTKVDRSKHVQSWTLEVDAPGGVPTHVDHSGGWKGDRTYGWGLAFVGHAEGEDWKVLADEVVRSWVLEQRARTGFIRPDPIEGRG